MMKTMRYLSWLAIAAMIVLGGCSTRIEPYKPSGGGSHSGGGSGSGGNTPQPTVQVTERTDWKVEYKGRVDYKEDDGTVSRVEEFFFNYTGDNLFFLVTLSDEDYANFYDSQVKNLIDGEVKDLNTRAQNEGKQVSEMDNVYTKRIKTLYADIMIHGWYNAFLVELDRNGKATYNYCRADMEVKEEEASPDYLGWLGTWNVSDGYVGYDIQVTAIENNYLYRVDGWETGPAAGSTQMNQDDDWIEARLIDDGTLSFFIQFIASYENYESLGNVDYMFVGTYVESTGEKVDDWEGWEIAWAENDGNGKTVLCAANTEYEVDGKVYKPHFNGMRYSLYSYKDESWHHFHDAVPTFLEQKNWQLSMTRTKASVEEDRTPVHTRNYLRKTQPRKHEGKRQRRF
jgi:hypothetical protein